MKIRLILAVSFCNIRIIGWAESKNADKTVVQLTLAAKLFAREHNIEDWKAVFFVKSKEYEVPKPEKDGRCIFLVQNIYTDQVNGIATNYCAGLKLCTDTDTVFSYYKLSGDMCHWVENHRWSLFW